MAQPPLVVILEGRVIGQVQRTRANRLRFTYEDDATLPGRTPLSLSMPTGDLSFADERVERWLRALLPESNGALNAVGRRYPGVDRSDPLSLLAALGKDCPGAVQFCAPLEVAEVVSRGGTLEPQSASDIEQRLAELRINENASWVMPGEHWSLGGTQAKFALRRVGEKWFEAQGSQPTSHILKPGVHGMKAQALVEHISMRAAAACGVDVAFTEHIEFKTESAIVIKRFDRRPEGEGLARLHQEDLCQALGVSEKYEEHGGPSAARIIAMLRDYSSRAREARANVNHFVDGLIFNTIIGAPDAHARNYALMLDGESVRLAPLFDISTGLVYESQESRLLSMSIGGEFHSDKIGREHWARFAGENELDEERVLDRAREMAEVAPVAMRTALDEVDDDDWTGAVAELRERLVPALDARTRQNVEALGTSAS
ncbi:type II toxin-antitoxin system HipA family toxin [Cellulomonas sp. 179-A 9B4 NHS]|uniref:type II toxin-antitoxin system HipA family toxin n=1 Tax=Cellulomonas sp. 179-A 9B4 NHS TaxID=3142379 RepID=UPI0039A227B1